MKSPKGGDGYYDKFSRWIFKIYSYRWIQYFIAPLLLSLPPLLLTKYVDNAKFHADVSDNLPDIAEFLDRYYLLPIILGSVYTGVALAFAKSIMQRVNTRGLNTDGLLSVSQKTPFFDSELPNF